MSPVLSCILILVGLFSVAAVVRGLVVLSERPSRDELESQSLVHWKFTPEQWRTWAKMEWAPVQERLKKVFSKPLTWVVVASILVPLVVVTAIAYMGQGAWLALATFALLMLVPLTLLIAYLWVFRALSRRLRMSVRRSGEVWISPKGLRDSLGRSIVFRDKHQQLAKAEIRMTAFGPAIYLERLSWVEDVANLGVSYIRSGSFLILIPPGKENEADLVVGALRGSAHMPEPWARDYPSS